MNLLGLSISERQKENGLLSVIQCNPLFLCLCFRQPPSRVAVHYSEKGSLQRFFYVLRLRDIVNIQIISDHGLFYDVKN